MGFTDADSADANINSQATGAMSWAFMTALKEKPQQSYVELLNSVRDLLEGDYSQRPQLSSSHPIGEFPSPSALSLALGKRADGDRHRPPLHYVVPDGDPDTHLISRRSCIRTQGGPC